MIKETVLPLIHLLGDEDSPWGQAYGSGAKEQRDRNWERIKPLVEALEMWTGDNPCTCHWCDRVLDEYTALANLEGPQTATAIVIRAAAGERDAIRKEMEKP